MFGKWAHNSILLLAPTLWIRLLLEWCYQTASLKTWSHVAFALCQAQFNLHYVLSRGVYMRHCDLHALLPLFVLPQPQISGFLKKPVVSTTDLSVLPKLTLRGMGFPWLCQFQVWWSGQITLKWSWLNWVTDVYWTDQGVWPRVKGNSGIQVGGER